ncbi:MAG: hypothetical protein ACP5N2_06805 [Candidatus Nanoarchaeia archaeon]
MKLEKNKKGQIETMGLLVIVILISLILFFALSFSLNNKQEEKPAKKEFKQTQAISNLGTTMLESTGPCGWTIRELLTDCAYTKEITCDLTFQNSCEAASTSMQTILDYTLDEWGYEYNLTVSTTQGNRIVSIAEGCIDDSNSQKEITPFGTIYGSMSMIILSCN